MEIVLRVRGSWQGFIGLEVVLCVGKFLVGWVVFRVVVGVQADDVEVFIAVVEV